MKKRELINLGFPRGRLLDDALAACGAAREAGRSIEEIRSAMEGLVREPAAHRDDPHFGPVARAMTTPENTPNLYRFNDELRYDTWGDEIDAGAHDQMKNACRLPVSVAGALMADAHVGYGLPIGGVLATESAVIPYAVGVDIACRVRLTVFDLPTHALVAEKDRYETILERETRFGTGAGYRGRERVQHEVMDAAWYATPLTRELKDKAWAQLGTSGSGNHFVEFGEIEFGENGLGVRPGRYVAVVSHSGSRGAGATIAAHYSKLARELHPNLPKQLSYLAWLPMDGEGAEYWAAMELMGQYAHANHDVIHRKIMRAVDRPVVFGVENHHNFAWKETHGGRELIVHRKGATPAGKGVLGYIPGSMTAPGFLVEGLGKAESLDSASHGAGRRLSRTKARESTRWNHLKATLEKAGVTLLSAGLDESPHAYKDIEAVMKAQADLVRAIARFQPRIVKMAADGERPED